MLAEIAIQSQTTQTTQTSSKERSYIVFSDQADLYEDRERKNGGRAKWVYISHTSPNAGTGVTAQNVADDRDSPFHPLRPSDHPYSFMSGSL